MLIASIDGVAYNSQSCQIMFSKHLKKKNFGELVTIKRKVN